MADSNPGIKQLMKAEQEAGLIVAEARKGKKKAPGRLRARRVAVRCACGRGGRM